MTATAESTAPDLFLIVSTARPRAQMLLGGDPDERQAGALECNTVNQTRRGRRETCSFERKVSLNLCLASIGMPVLVVVHPNRGCSQRRQTDTAP